MISIRHITLVLAVFLLPCSLAAQIPPLHAPPAGGLVGESWDLVDLDGDPVNAPNEVYLEVEENAAGEVKAQFWIKKPNEKPKKIEDEITLVGGPLYYTWEHGELQGWMRWNPLANAYVYYTSARGGLTRALKQRDKD